VDDDDLQRVSPLLTPDVRSVLTVRGALEARKEQGGTAPARVAEQLAALRTLADQHAAWATS
jgi:argininosuccinate lyase